MARQRIGSRRHVASASKFTGSLDNYGTPNYSDGSQWTVQVTGWPCERLTTRGGETVRGRQTTETTTHVFIGEYYGGRQITPEMRLTVNGIVYAVTAAYDPDGDNREWRVEARIES